MNRANRVIHLFAQRKRNLKRAQTSSRRNLWLRSNQNIRQPNAYTAPLAPSLLTEQRYHCRSSVQRATRQQITHLPWIHRRTCLTPARQDPDIHTRSIPLHAAPPRPFRRLRDTQLTHLQPNTIDIASASGHIRWHGRHAPRAAGIPIPQRAAAFLRGAPHPLIGSIRAGCGSE